MSLHVPCSGRVGRGSSSRSCPAVAAGEDDFEAVGETLGGARRNRRTGVDKGPE